ncbi:cyclopropane-fatty-acyl-phospholipid synthase family protein [Pedobacter gandavensis]|uniref:SAM-dependent methyltransferase n=1 Tax=Pedobacter TaxID=84567 RepID=UPI001C99F618|nr:MULTISPECIES: cyclopropane-fatty-acyl-phospholipid synthase family protein [Pedobacter]WGQ12124.1 cyclopropane-fatty-acyl-phospholipid synthase family protein [Pedobacter gandavensis]
MWYNTLIEQNKLPDFILRTGIRRLLKKRLQDETIGDAEAQQHRLNKLIAKLKTEPIAVHTQDANQQHYEVPTAFYQYCLGKHLKYSSGYWNPGVTSLDTSEQDMLELTTKRADLKDGQDILELGCGWGSLTLFMAQKYPASQITAVSNSATQKAYIDQTAKERKLHNITVITEDINVFKSPIQFDRILSVEMFEHMRNYELLMGKIASFMKDDGRLFVHIFSHHTLAYKFEVKDETDWMSKYFFTGGIMPSNHLLLYFNQHLTAANHWVVNGTNYAKTSEAWLKNMDAHKKEIMPILRETYGADQALKWWVYWRLFYLSCAELFAYNEGNEWMVCHYLFKKKA